MPGQVHRERQMTNTLQTNATLNMYFGLVLLACSAITFSSVRAADLDETERLSESASTRLPPLNGNGYTRPSSTAPRPRLNQPRALPNRSDAAFVEALNDALLLEVDGDSAAGLSHAEPLRNAVDRNDPLGSQENRTTNSYLTNRAASPNCHRVGGFDVALHRGSSRG
jgi:hypothetical protein